MEAKIIYVRPDHEEDLDWFLRLNNEEKLHVAKNSNDMVIYHSLEDFADDFNAEDISDLGYIYPIRL